MDEENPFAELFSSSEAVHQATDIAKVQKVNVSNVLTKIFLFTIISGKLCI